MPELIRIQYVWQGFSGAPGYSNFMFYADPATQTLVNNASATVQSFFNGVKTFLPTGTTVTGSGVAGVYSLNGQKIAEYSYTPALGITGTSATAYAGGTGAVIQWKTGQYVNGRPFTGRTFLVPLAGGYEANGTLQATTIISLNTAANILKSATGPAFHIYGKDSASGLGHSAPVTAVVIPDRSATMRSRR